MGLLQAVVKNAQPEPEEQWHHSPEEELPALHRSGKKQQSGERVGKFPQSAEGGRMGQVK